MTKAKPLPKDKQRKNLFIVDDHPVFREGLVRVISQEPDLNICGQADTAARALMDIERLKPNLVLADIGLPGRSGLELIKDLRTVRPESAVLVVSMHDETLYAERVLRAGGRGYIMKQEGPEKILEAIRRVLDGQLHLSAKVSARILDTLSGHRPKSESPIARLTDREFEILQLIGRGQDTRDIAEQLHLSIKTVDTHRGHIKEKLEMKSGTELICYATRWVEAEKTVGV